MSCKKVALIDLDNTVVDHEGQLNKDLYHALGDDLYKVSPEVREKVGYLIKNTPGWWANLLPLPFGMSIVDTLREVGFELVICSKGPRRAVGAWTEKVQWVQRYLPDANIVLTQDKSLVYGRLLVDDWPEYIEPWLEVRPRGIVLMPATKANKSFKHPRVHRLANYDDIQAVRPLLQKIFDREGGEDYCEPKKPKRKSRVVLGG